MKLDRKFRAALRRHAARFALSIAMALVATGCGSNRQGSQNQNNDHERPADSEKSSLATANSSASIAPIDPATSGSIAGVVKLAGVPPLLKPIDMDAAPACVRANPSPVVPPEVVAGKDGSMAGVAVYVKSGLGDRHFDAPKNPVVLEQKACMYEPRVVALMTNQTLEIRNDDPTTHNVHAIAKRNESWNRSQPPGGPLIEQSFSKPELAIPIACNVHPWMRAFAFVFSNPYYAVTTKTGRFELKNLPPGTYTIEAWQERYGTQDQTVTIASRESKAISFTFKANGTSASNSGGAE